MVEQDLVLAGGGGADPRPRRPRRRAGAAWTPQRRPSPGLPPLRCPTRWHRHPRGRRIATCWSVWTMRKGSRRLRRADRLCPLPRMPSTSPDPTQTGGAVRAMIGRPGCSRSRIDYMRIPLGTATLLDDSSETLAIKVLGEYAYQLPVAADESVLGHALGHRSDRSHCQHLYPAPGRRPHLDV